MDCLDPVVALASRVEEEQEFSEQTDGETLNAQAEQERAQNAKWAVSGGHVEEDPLKSDRGQQDPADCGEQTFDAPKRLSG